MVELQNIDIQLKDKKKQNKISKKVFGNKKRKELNMIAILVVGHL